MMVEAVSAAECPVLGQSRRKTCKNNICAKAVFNIITQQRLLMVVCACIQKKKVVSRAVDCSVLESPSVYRGALLTEERIVL